MYQESLDIRTLIQNAENVAELRAQLEEAISINEVCTLKAFAHECLDPKVRQRLVDLLCEDQQAFDFVVKQSYYHENGFDKIVLLAGANFKVRFHRFHPSSEVKAMENIHNHRWHFASAMLSGSFHSKIYEIGECGERVEHYIYNSDKSSGTYEIDHLGQRFAQEIDDIHIAKGQSYFLDAHLKHRICEVDPMGATTLIITGKEQTNTCNLLSRTKFAGENQAVIPLSTDQIINDLILFTNV